VIVEKPKGRPDEKIVYRLTCAVASWQATRYGLMIRPVMGKGNENYVWAKLEVTDATNNVLIVRVVKMSIENFLRECERTLESGGQLKRVTSSSEE
jgi:hypothetical protein